MSCEGDHVYERQVDNVPDAELKALRQALYDAKLELASADISRARDAVNRALDISQGWTTVQKDA